MALKSINTGSEPHQSLLIGHMSVHESRDTGNNTHGQARGVAEKSVTLSE